MKSFFYALYATFALSSISAQADELRIGVIGLDTPHASDFTRILNDPQALPELAGCRVVAAVDAHSPDNADSVKLHPTVVEAIRKLEIQIVPSIPEMLARVDAVLVESIDGRAHLEQVLPVLQAKLPVFVDKPVAATLADVLVIYKLAEHYQTPIFSSSALRYAETAAERNGDSVGPIVGCDTFSPSPLEEHHSRFFWYGIHGVEMLFTGMGVGCESVVCVSTDDTDVAVGQWQDGRIGTFRGRRAANNGYASGYGGTVLGSHGVRPLGGFSGYEPLVQQIVRFFRERRPPVSPDETIEIYAFMEAAAESQRLGGTPVEIEAVLEQAQKQAQQKLQKMGVDIQ